MDLANEVKQDIENRIIKGIREYGERLKPFNGRNALLDAYEEILDLALYIKQELTEKQAIQVQAEVSKPFDWQPWEDYKKTTLLALPITEPPCKNCKFWNPQPQFTNLRTGMKFDGVICCHAEYQHQDFSCYNKDC